MTETEIEDIQGIIMGGVDQPILDPHNLMVNTDKTPTQEERRLERRIGRLEHRNTYLKKVNEQLRELNKEFERACNFLIAECADNDMDVYCTFCGPILQGQQARYDDHNIDCPWMAAKRALELKAKFDTANKRLGGE